MTPKTTETVSGIKKLLEEHGLAPNRRFGQNFLVEAGVYDVISRLAEVSARDVVLEVGTGLATLTSRLCAVAGHVVSVEIDAGLHGLARRLLGEPANLSLIHDDVMASKSTLSETVCAAVEAACRSIDAGGLKVVANLPYSISTPFLNALLTRFVTLDRAVLLVQREFSENLVARAGDRGYSPLSVMVNLLFDVRLDRIVRREVFWPRPKVESALVVLDKRPGASRSILAARPLTAYLFRERRKTVGALMRRLPETCGGPLAKEVSERALSRAGLQGNERAESLAPARFVELFESTRLEINGS